MTRSGRPRTIAVLATVALTLLGGTACAAGAPPQGDGPAELVLAIQQTPNSLDPAQLSAGQPAYVWTGLYDTLLQRENRTGELLPNAAQSWEYTDEGRTLTLTLREDLTFSDGDPVTAADVVATMERVRTTPGIVQAHHDAVTAVEAADERTVVVRFDRYAPAFLDALTSNAGAIGDAETVGAERTANDPVGSGPYVLDPAATVQPSTWVLRKRTDHWNAAEFPFETVTVRVLQDPTAAVNALQAGEVNAVSVQARQRAAVEGIPGVAFTTVEAAGAAVINLVDRGGVQTPALGDLRVRQAINLAIDREGIVAALFQGIGRPSQQVFSPFGPVFDESLEQAYPYDPERARQLLAEAGYADGFTVTMPSLPVTAAVEPTLTQQFADVGITLNWVPTPPQQATATTQGRDHPMNYQVFSITSFADRASSLFEPDGLDNPFHHTDAVLDDLFARIGTTSDPEASAQLHRELNRHVVEQALVAPVGFVGATWATRDGVVYADDGSSGVSSLHLFDVAAIG